MAGRATWWVVASDQDPEHGYHWDRYFNEPMDPRESYNWGGPKWINSSVSFSRIREMRAGDRVVAYQARQGVLGFAALASDGYQSADEGAFDTFDLAGSPTIRLGMPIPYAIIRDLPNAKDNFEFVRLYKRGSVYRVTSIGFADLLRLATQLNPDQASAFGCLK